MRLAFVEKFADVRAAAAAKTFSYKSPVGLPCVTSAPASSLVAKSGIK